jgi:dienelactone hydrolase
VFLFETKYSGNMKKMVLNLALVSIFAHYNTAQGGNSELKFETVYLTNAAPAARLDLVYRPGTVPRHPAILMIGSLKSNQPPDWSTNLVNEGYLLVAFTVDHPPDSDPAKRPQWLYFDERFAHSYVLGGYRAATDVERVAKYLASRGDVNSEKLGWLGSSSTGIPGLAVATRGPRLAAIVAFVSTGAYRQWLETWKPNGLWRGKRDMLWPETETLLRYDPILHVDKMFPTAVLMVNGAEDKVVDPKTARAFMDAARPYYRSDPERLRLVLYEGFGHNLPVDIIRMYAEHWFHLYMHPTDPPPLPAKDAENLTESVRRTQINAADHKKIIRAE